MRRPDGRAGNDAANRLLSPSPLLRLPRQWFHSGALVVKPGALVDFPSLEGNRARTGELSGIALGFLQFASCSVGLSGELSLNKYVRWFPLEVG